MTTATAETTDQVTVERSHLTQAIAQVLPAAARRGTSLPALTGIRLQNDKGKLRLTATDLETTVSTVVDAHVPKGFDVVVGGTLFRNLVREAAGPVTMTHNAKDHDLVVTWARTVAILKTFPVEEYPKHISLTGPGEILELSAVDVDRLRKIANFSSRDDCRPILTGMYFCPDGVVATDSYRLGVVELEADTKALEGTYLVPSTIARHLPMGLLGSETATMTFENGTKGEPGSAVHVRVDVGEITIRTVLISGEFPPYRKLMPATAPVLMTFDRTDFHKAVRTAKVLCQEATPVRIEIADDQKTATIKSATQDVGQLATMVDLKNLHTERGATTVTCAFNVDYLAAMVATLGGDEITMEITDALKPMLIREGPWRLLLMPVRVS